jgi:predicted metallopeptidase
MCIIFVFKFIIVLEFRSQFAAQSKVWVCSCSPAEIVGLNPTGVMDICLS